MVKFRLYFDKDAETAWLQKLADRGLKLQGFFLGFYRFTSCEPGEYQYQIDLLNNWSGDRQDYTEFMEETKVRVVGQWWRWVYLEKRTEDGLFELYTDTESLVEQYTRIKNFFLVAFMIELVCMTIEFMVFMDTGHRLIGIFLLIIGLILVVLLRIIWKCKWKITEMKQNRR